MIKELQLTLTPEEAYTETGIKKAAAKMLHENARDLTHIQIVKKSIDARMKDPVVVLKVKAYVHEMPQEPENKFPYKNVDGKPEVIIVGSGPAGLFAALKLLENGIKPIILERGKRILERKQDVAQINRNNSLDEESNYCFGEGGAGTFSDGKLYTRSNKRGNTQHILEVFHHFGAQDEILYETHPHIGTDVLPKVIKSICDTIEHFGGELHFGAKVTDLIIENDTIKGVQTADGEKLMAKAVILATGHSARDIYELLQRKNIAIEAKGFAMGVRVEHPQSLIDSMQYHRKERGEYLPAAKYNLAQQVDGRGVYSFCMCPGGHIVPAGSGSNQVVVNGMSGSQRNSPFANSGIIVEIRPEDLNDYQQYGVLAGLHFQEELENLAYVNNGNRFQMAPGQRLGDFVKGRLSSDLPECSYLPGTISSPLHFWLPNMISKRLREGFKAFDRKMHGYLTNNAMIVGVESRSSSPVRIPRDSETLEHIQIHGLYPCGEGSGYAGGITSSAMDGERCAKNAAEMINN